MAGEKIKYIGSATPYQDAHGDAWNPKVAKPIDDERGVKLNLEQRGLPPSAITGGIPVKNGMRDSLYPKPDLGPQGAGRPWRPKGRSNDHDSDD